MDITNYIRSRSSSKMRIRGFYNGALTLKFLNSTLDNLPLSKVLAAQKSMAKLYYKNYQNSQALTHLNSDLVKKNWERSQQEVENYAQTNIAKRLDNEFNDLMREGYKINHNNVTPETLKSLETQLNNLFLQYKKFLTQIEAYKPLDSRVGTNFFTFEELLNGFEQRISMVLQDPNVSITSGFLNRLYSCYYKIRGYLLEDEFEQTANNWLNIHLKEGNNKNITNIKMQLFGTGQLFVDGLMAGIDEMVFEDKILDEYMITYTRGLVGSNPKDRTPVTSTLREFFAEMNDKKNINTSFFIEGSTYTELIQQTIATIQSKAHLETAGIRFKSNVQLFEQNTVSYKKFQYQHLRPIKAIRSHLQAIAGLNNLYHLSKVIHGGQGHFVSRSDRLGMLINYSLRNMMNDIFKDNTFILTSQKGLVTVYDLFTIYQNRILRWGNMNTQVDFNTDLTDKRDIIFK